MTQVGSGALLIGPAMSHKVVISHTDRNHQEMGHAADHSITVVMIYFPTVRPLENVIAVANEADRLVAGQNWTV